MRQLTNRLTFGWKMSQNKYPLARLPPRPATKLTPLSPRSLLLDANFDGDTLRCPVEWHGYRGYVAGQYISISQ
jgi:hypothetical protein